MSYVDTHCHLYDTRGVPVDDVIAAARAAGVTTMIDVGCDAATTAAAVAMASQHDDIWATAGLHPHEAVHGVDSIVEFLDHPKVVAVGECGLDYYYDHSPRDIQRTAFAAQIQLAHERRLPLVIHTRDAWADTFDVLRAEGVPTQTIFHCFTGGPDEADACLDSVPSSASAASSRSRQQPRCRPQRCAARSIACSPRPTARTWHRRLTVAVRTNRRSSPTSCSSSPTCAASPRNASVRPQRGTHALRSPPCAPSVFPADGHRRIAVVGTGHPQPSP